uniref:AMP-activated protein kinase glycogen-binding domain-containing protein n=1 Tax=Gracilinema caldarium TaxID=215591 RepID=A0A7C3EBH7_9SPIR
MMECSQIVTLLDSWEQKERISPGDVQIIQVHLDHCPRCNKRFGPLLPLLQRDAGILSQVPQLHGIEHSPTTDAIMAGIVEREIPGRKGVTATIIPWVAAAALVVLLPLGYLLYTHRTSDVVTVRFVLEAPGATTVMVSGNFNQWSSMDIPLKPEGDGKTWSATVQLKRSFEYRYNFVIDNQIWIEDPHAAVSIDDDFGGKVSLLDL